MTNTLVSSIFIPTINPDFMNQKTLQQLGEFGTISHLQKSLALRDGVRVGIGDDAAVLDALSCPVVTCDCLVEDVHFRRDWMTPRQLGCKALVVNVSDIAAMKARPVAAFVTLALSARDDLHFVEELYAGLEEVAREYNFSVAGGDTSRSTGGLMLSITLVGESKMPVLRSGAQDGDILLVTGTLGDSAAGLAILQNPDSARALDDETRNFLIARHLEPTPRLREISSLPNGIVHAALDLSDGLAGDARHIAKCSALDLHIETALIPLSTQCLRAAQISEHRVLDWALGGGEDYELLLCVAPRDVATVTQIIADSTGTRVTIIGRCAASPNVPRVHFHNADGTLKNAQAWTHF